MLLPQLIIPSRAKKHYLYSGTDTIEKCFNKKHFLSYPHKIDYQYNSRGFRDCEWPDDLDNVIWCLGDSFTVGIGVPINHTWWHLLQQQTGIRIINVSMDGASNNWIGRMANDILTEYPNAKMIVHWSFLHRRELSIDEAKKRKFQEFYRDIKDSTWPDVDNIDELPIHIQTECVTIHGWDEIIHSDHRIIWHDQSRIDKDIENTQGCIDMLGSRVIHSAIPNWAPPKINLPFDHVIQLQQLDRGRDYHHYDIITAQDFVKKITAVLGHYANW